MQCKIFVCDSFASKKCKNQYSKALHIFLLIKDYLSTYKSNTDELCQKIIAEIPQYNIVTSKVPFNTKDSFDTGCDILMMFHYLMKENNFYFKKYMSEYNVPDIRRYMFYELLQFLDIIGCNTNDFLNVFDEDNQTFVRNMKHFISKRVKKKSNETNSTCDNFLFNENKTGLTQEYYNSELVIEEKKEKENTELKQHLEKMFPFHNLNN